MALRVLREVVSSDVEALSSATMLIHHEARCLDDRRWSDWLGLYDADAEFWVPAWKNELEPTRDPHSEVSLIYMMSRRLLTDRVTRASSGQSIASTPPPRTAHAITNIEASARAFDTIEASALCTTHVFDLRFGHHHVTLGRYEFEFGSQTGKWLIRRKKITLLNDPLPPILDFYTV